MSLPAEGDNRSASARSSPFPPIARRISTLHSFRSKAAGPLSALFQGERFPPEYLNPPLADVGQWRKQWDIQNMTQA